MKSIFSIKNKVIIITGVSSGIGKYIAEQLVLHDAIVYGISRGKVKNPIFNNIVCDLSNFSLLKKN